MMKKFTLAIAAASLLLFACKTDKTTAEAVPFADALSNYSQGECAQLFDCCNASETAAQGFATEAECITANTTDSDTVAYFDALKTAIDAGTVTYSAKEAGKCIAARTAMGCTQPDAIPASCEKIFVGTIADGSMCNMNDECMGTYSWCAEGVCNSYEGVAENGSCNTSNDIYCAENLYCDYSSSTCLPYPILGASCANSYQCDNAVCDMSTSTCVEFYTAGTSCTSDDNCAEGLSCIATAAGAPGTCKAPVADGAYCDNDQDCQSDNCKWENNSGTCDLAFSSYVCR